MDFIVTLELHTDLDEDAAEELVLELLREARAHLAPDERLRLLGVRARANKGARAP